MPMTPGSPIFAPSWARSKLTALMSAPAPNARTRPMTRLGHGRTTPMAAPITSDEAAMAPQRIASVTAPTVPSGGDGPTAVGQESRSPRPEAAPRVTAMEITTDAQASALHGADSHDLIRVHGARVNNLKDVSVELPKRRLTVFTGVSGSGKSSLVFGTIAAESQRLINETYSSFVQGFMPSLARPDVDVLEGLTTAILV